MKSSHKENVGGCEDSSKEGKADAIDHDNSVSFEEDFGEDINEDEMEEIGRRRTRSMTAIERRELERDRTSTFWLQMENTECFNDVTVFAVEIPVAEHKEPEVIEAKEKELENLTKYDVFEEVEDSGQERITSRWVITRKERADGQKADYKG